MVALRPPSIGGESSWGKLSAYVAAGPGSRQRQRQAFGGPEVDWWSISEFLSEQATL